MKFLSYLLLGTFALTGCQATQRHNATTGQPETNSATKGVILGALAGAAAGAITGDDSKDRQRRALYGALGGAAVGGGVGYYFDKQEAELHNTLVNSGVQVQRLDENQLLLIMKNGIGFQSGSFALDSSIHQTLNGVAAVIARYPETKLVVTTILIAPVMIRLIKYYPNSVPCKSNPILLGNQSNLEESTQKDMASVILFATMRLFKDALAIDVSRFKYCPCNPAYW